MQSQTPKSGGKVPGSPDFLITLGVIGSFVALTVIAGSDATPRWLRGAAAVILAPAAMALMVGIWGSLIALPAWAMWKGARAADAKLPPPGGMLTVLPDEGPLASTVPKERPISHHWGSPEWILSGLGIGGEAGLIVSLVLGQTTAAAAFGTMFLIGAGGWIIKLNVDHLRGIR